MRKFLSNLIPVLIVATTGFAQDIVVLNNGDTLTGKILKQDAQQVYFKSSAFGSVSLNTRDISEVRITTEELGEIEVPAEALAPAEPQAEPVVTPQVARENPTPPPQAEGQPKKPKQWTGQAGLAIAMRESNTLRRSADNVVEKQESFESYRIYGNVNWKGARNDLKWNWTYRYSRSDLRLNDDFLSLTQNYKHSFEDKNYFASAKTVYQRDYRRRIENEYLQTAEIGIKWFDRTKFQLSTSAGGGYHKYDRLVYNSSTQENENLAVSQPTFIFDEKLRWQLVNSLTLIQKYTHLGDLTNYHFIFSGGLENKLVRDLFLRLEYRIDRDTEVSYDDKGYYDKALLTSLLYKF
ncbi:MAG: DUF481 domain-containing protein [Verrucomicrobiota bacterium]|nr:DUF481 domain-containing protein [Verrucomicrobiota bacterium]